jgi:hypothetical protein
MKATHVGDSQSKGDDRDRDRFRSFDRLARRVINLARRSAGLISDILYSKLPMCSISLRSSARATARRVDRLRALALFAHAKLDRRHLGTRRTLVTSGDTNPAAAGSYVVAGLCGLIQRNTNIGYTNGGIGD